MDSLRDIVKSSPQLRAVETNASYRSEGEEAPRPLGPALWDWNDVRKVLLVRLRSIGDTVLATPSLFALKRFLPHAQVDILVEEWVAPVLEAHPVIDNVVSLERGSLAARAKTARQLRSTCYDVVYNLHGGTTATLLTRATGAPHRVGYKTYQYAQLHNHQSPSSSTLWSQEKTHSVEQQLALLGWTGVPVTDRPATQLGFSAQSLAIVNERLNSADLLNKRFALIHPAAAFATKQWAAENFAKVVEFLADAGLTSVAIAGPGEAEVLNRLIGSTSTRVVTFDLTLPQVSALASRASLFVGNDSGIAHIAAAIGTPSVVIFGSSNRAHWSPWTRGAAEVVFEEMECQPCHGYHCDKFAQPECILRVPVARVTAAIERLMSV